MVELARESAQLSGNDGALDGGHTAAEAPRATCAIWGVLNVTPDSFSDGGAHLAPDAAIAAGLRMVAQGADVIDIGGESTRPAGTTYGSGAPRVSDDEELARVVPVVAELSRRGVVLSIDTTKPAVARRACELGVAIVNDVSGGRDPALLRVVADHGAELVLMHNRGNGECSGENVRYADVVGEVRSELLAALARAAAAGVAGERVWLDPGIGFAKTARQSLTLLAHIDALLATGQRVLVGTSRKSFLADLTRDPSGALPAVHERLGATAASVAYAALRGAHAVRVHDVVEMRQVAMLSGLLREARG